jgi:site-specific recombinase XerD
MQPATKNILSAFPAQVSAKQITRSYAASNLELSSAFSCYVSTRGFSAQTVKTYTDTVGRFIEALGSTSAVEAGRPEIRKFLGNLLGRGCSANTARKHTCALRSFFKFLQLARLTRHDPTIMLSQRKIPRRIPRVLTIAEVDRLIAAAKTPVEAAVAEFLYATGVRVSELVAVRLENIDFAQEPCIAHVKKGKGGKDRTVPFGRPAHAAIKKMLERQPSETGFLFEARQQTGSLRLMSGAWYGCAYLNAVQQHIRIGTVSEYRTRADARRAFGCILAITPGYRPKPPRRYTDRAIRLMVSRMGVRAGIGKVYPHALRRAFASHMLQDGADLRAIQEILGHERVTTTALYTSLSALNLKEIHTRCHPTAGGNEDAETK